MALNLTWAEAISHGRLERLAAAGAAAAGLANPDRETGTGTTGPDTGTGNPYLQWRRDRKDRITGAEVGRTPSPDAGADTARARMFTTTREIEDWTRERLIDGVEHRRQRWQIWDETDPALHPDEARLLLAPVPGESAAEEAVTVEIRARPALDGSLDPNSVRVIWTSVDAQGAYPPTADDRLERVPTGRPKDFSPADHPAVREYMTAALWAAGLYTITDVRPKLQGDRRAAAGRPDES